MMFMVIILYLFNSIIVSLSVKGEHPMDIDNYGEISQGNSPHGK